MIHSNKEIIYRCIKGISTVLTVAVCAVILAQVASIYFEGISEGHEGDIFTRELLGGRVLQYAPLYLAWLIALIAEVVTYNLFGIHPKKSKPTFYAEDTLRRMRNGLSDEGIKQYCALPEIKTLQKRKWIVWTVCLLVVAVCAVFCMIYVFDSSNFPAQNLMGDVATMAIHILPFVIVGLGMIVTAKYVNSYICKEELELIKKIYTDKEARLDRKELAERATAVQKKKEKPVWAIRAVIAVFGIVFVIMGVSNGGMQDVLMKAIKICTECIGLG